MIEPKRVIVLEPNPETPEWLLATFKLDELKGEYIPTPPHSEFEEYMDRLQGVDRFARHRDEIVPNPLYMELFV